MELPTDWTAFFAALRQHRVRFILIGAHALAAHGRPRFTQDLGILIDPTEANARRLGAALGDFGFAGAGRAAARLASGDRMMTLGHPPLQIDILNRISGVTFRTAWKHRVALGTPGGEIPVLGLADLRANKLASGRPKDLLDLALLDEGAPASRVRAQRDISGSGPAPSARPTRRPARAR